MSTVTTDNQHYSDIAAAIREKLGVQTLYLPSQMAAAIQSIESGGRCPRTEPRVVFMRPDGIWTATAAAVTE